MRFFRLSLLAVLLFTVAASAQYNRFNDHLRVNFNQPVAVSKDLTLQPGTYTFAQVDEPDQPNVFTVIDQSGKSIGMTAKATSAQANGPNQLEHPAKTHVVLKQVGDKMYLSQIWFSGQNKGYDFGIAQDEMKREGISAKDVHEVELPAEMDNNSQK